MPIKKVKRKIEIIVEGYPHQIYKIWKMLLNLCYGDVKISLKKPQPLNKTDNKIKRSDGS